MRQLGLALKMYLSENDDYFPPRSYTERWPSRLLDGYRSQKILLCVSDGLNPQTQGSNTNYLADTWPRSYIINAFNDYFQTSLDPTNWTAYTGGNYHRGMRETGIPHTSDTVVFGEKETTSGHFYMDFFQGNGNDVDEIEQSRHSGNGPKSGGGGSNYTFVDGSARYLKFGRAMTPVNLWAVSDAARFKYGTQ
jgi:prepilin-type processing-associated H-X9-DG protein